MLKKAKPYIISIAIALAIGGAAALLTRNSMDIYSEIATPPLSPPSILFPIVWTILYILMGISAAIIYTSQPTGYATDCRREGLMIYALSLIVNFFWSIFFFNARWFLFSFFWLVLLWALILATIMKYRKVSPLAAYLQIPYLLWVTFAGYLNFGIFILN